MEGKQSQSFNINKASICDMCFKKRIVQPIFSLFLLLPFYYLTTYIPFVPCCRVLKSVHSISHNQKMKYKDEKTKINPDKAIAKKILLKFIKVEIVYLIPTLYLGSLT